jgi:AcrR family transcriptional regulator
VNDEGPSGLTMERLSRATGLSRATLYRRSGGREALLDALAASGTDVGDRSDARARILRAARDVFARDGFDAASIDEIAATADVGAVTVYRHFGDKDGLVAAFLDELPPRRAVRESPLRASGDVRADLEGLAERMLAGMRDEAPIVRLVVLETLRGSPMLSRVRTKAPLRNVKALASMFRAHCSAGRLRDVDPDLLAQTFAGTVFAFGAVGPILHGESIGDPKQTARRIADLFLLGALPRETSRP